MLGRLLLLFILVPLCELWLLFVIGGWIGGGATLALVLSTGALGLVFARRESQKVLRGWQEATSSGALPDEGVVSGLLVMVGGFLLVIPGVVTDVLGAALLIGPTRRLLVSSAREQLRRRMQAQGMGGVLVQGGMTPPWGNAPTGDIIDVESHPKESSAGDATRERHEPLRALDRG